MKIILDTNIIRQDLSFRGAKFKALKSFAEKTRSELILPQLVKEELIGLFRRDLKKQVERIKSIQNECERSPYWTKVDLVEQVGNTDEIVARFCKALNAEFPDGMETLIPYKSEYLSDIVRRAIDRVKPISESGEEFRDALIWVGMREFIKGMKGRREEFSFISNNTREFADAAKKQLHPDLVEELGKDAPHLAYYPDLEAFLREHAEPVEFLTGDWLNKNLPIGDVGVRIMESLEGSTALAHFAEQHGLHDVSDADVTDWSFDLSDFFVLNSDKAKRKIEVLAYLEGDWKIEFVGVSYLGGPAGGSWSILRSTHEGMGEATAHVVADVVCTIEDQKLVRWNIDRWTL